MDTETDTTLVEIPGLLEGTKASEQPQTDEEGALEDMLARSSTELVHAFATSISQSAMKEACKSDEFKQEFRRRLFRAILRTYVWSVARLTHETETSEGRLEREVQVMVSTEREQGRLWGRLTELMAAVKKAVDVFGAGL